MNIKAEIKLTDEKPSVVQVSNTNKSNIIAIGLKKDQILKKHVSPVPALLVMLEGSVRFEMEGSTTEITGLNTFDIPPNIPHEVAANEESIFLVIKEKG